MRRGITVLVRYTALPGQSDLAFTEVSALVAAVLAKEPECRGITVLRNVSDSAQITLVEEWPDQDSFLGAHMRQPHLQAFIERAPGFLTGPPDITFWRAH